MPILTFWRIHFWVFRCDHSTIRAIWRITIKSGSYSVYHENGRVDCGNWLELSLYLAQQLGPNWVTVMPPPAHFWYDCHLYLPTSYMWDMTYPALARNASMTWKHTQVPASYQHLGDHLKRFPRKLSDIFPQQSIILYYSHPFSSVLLDRLYTHTVEDLAII